jgi:hypothetical protein
MRSQQPDCDVIVCVVAMSDSTAPALVVQVTDERNHITNRWLNTMCMIQSPSECADEGDEVSPDLAAAQHLTEQGFRILLEVRQRLSIKGQN